MPRKATKLLERARRSAANFTLADLEQLYLGFGFKIRPGRHPIAKHPKYPQLRNTLPNHTSFASEYVRVAVKSIDRLLELEAEEDQRDDA